MYIFKTLERPRKLFFWSSWFISSATVLL